MNRAFSVELTTLCMIENGRGEILIQDRQKSDWPGWTFPGGHVKATESLKDAVIREIKEECGLNIDPTLKGVAEWLNDPQGDRELAGLFYATTTKEPQVRQGEAPLFWVAKDQLTASDLGGTLGKLLPIFLSDEKTTFFQDNSQKTN